MSATINCKEFAEYFGTPLLSQLNPAYVFEVEGAPYAIEQFYLDNLRGLIPFSVKLMIPPLHTHTHTDRITHTQHFNFLCEHFFVLFSKHPYYHIRSG